MILVIGDKHYPRVAVDELSLRHTLALQRELVLSNISEAKTWADVRRMFAEFAEMEPAERENHPEVLFLTAVTIWATRVSAGEELSLLDAEDVPVTSVRWVTEPGDKVAPAAAGKARARKAGAADAARGTGPTPKRP